MRELHGTTAVVTGGGSGIGMGIALGLADAGVQVVVADIELASAQRVAEQIRSGGGRALALHVDATDRASLDRLVASATHEYGEVNVLSNNVGVAHDSPLSELTDRDWSWFLDFGFLSIVRTVDAFLPELRDHPGQAHIVNTASMAGLVTLPFSSEMPRHIGAYTTTKHAVVAYTEMLRGELQPAGIGVSVLCPGMVQSNLSATSARNRPDRYGGKLPEPRSTPPAGRGEVMSARQVGPIVVAGIRAGRLHILTHPELRSAVERRQQQLLEDFDFFAALRATAGQAP